MLIVHIDNTADVKMKCDYVLVQNLSISALVELANILVDKFTMLAAKEYGITIGNFLFFNLKMRLVQTLLFVPNQKALPKSPGSYSNPALVLGK